MEIERIADTKNQNASVRSIEYGEIEIAPGQTKPAALLAVDFVFHPFESRVKEADVELAFSDRARERHPQ